MDLSTLPDLVQHFAIAVHVVPDFVHHIAHEAQSVLFAFSHNSEMGFVEKLYHGAKAATLGGLFIFSVTTGNVEGIIGTGLAEADEYYSLRREGEKVRSKVAPLPPA